MKFKNRIFLKTNNDIRKFLWLQQGSDGSIYIGSAGGKFSYGRKGVARVDKNDKFGTVIGTSMGDELVDKELCGKLSFHKSGIINLSTISVDKRDRLKTKAFSEFEGTLPLINITPMLPTKYPLSQKTVKDNDLVIDCGINKGKCFSIVIFIALNQLELGIFKALRTQYGLSLKVINVDIYDRKLCAMLYFNEKFLGWPKEQYSFISNPDDSGKISWLITIPSC